MQITMDEFRKLLGAVNEVRPGARVSVGAPPVATRNTDKVRCKTCHKQLWDCRCDAAESRFKH
jgi:hypothetical protein